MSEPTHPAQSSCTSCGVCFGTGQITGPKSDAYRYDPDDPFNRVVRLCDECEGTGVVTKLREAAMLAVAMQKVLPIVDKVMAEWREDAAAVNRWEAEGGAVHV